MKTLECVLLLQFGTRKWIAPGLGEYTDAVLGERGYTPTGITKMHQDGAI